MFDYFQPSFAIRCPKCGSYENEGQGKDGPCALLVWTERALHPVKQVADRPLDDADLRQFTLPERFEFVVSCNECQAVIRHGQGRCEHGVWAQTLINDY